MQFKATTYSAVAANSVAAGATAAGKGQCAVKSQSQQQKQLQQRQQKFNVQITSNEEVNCVRDPVVARVEVSPATAAAAACNSNNIKSNNGSSMPPQQRRSVQRACAFTDDSGCCKCNSNNNNNNSNNSDGQVPHTDISAADAVVVDVVDSACVARARPRADVAPTVCGRDKICANNKYAFKNETKSKSKCASETESLRQDGSRSSHNYQNSNSNKSGNCNSNSNNTSKGSYNFCSSCSYFHRSSNKIKYIATMLMLLFFLTCCDYTEAALSNVNLFIEPPAVRRGQAATLRCHYTLEGAPLYSVKFYRGNFEFFRYTPGEYPNVKVFHYPGIKVDESISNASQVVIRNVSFGLSGNFSCEVTADAPLYSTATAYAQMQVVEFPEKRPQLFTEHTRYEPGDILRANCSTPPSRPRADLRFTINNIPVSTGETQYIRTVDNLIASRLSLKLQLQVAHFAATAAAGANTQHLMNHLASPGNGNGNQATGIGVPYNTYGVGPGAGTSAATAAGNGGLVLRCTAQIGDLYQEYKEIELGTPQKDPVPARVTLSSGSSLRNFFETYFSTSAAAASSKRSMAGLQWRTHVLYLTTALGVIGSFHMLQPSIARR